MRTTPAPSVSHVEPVMTGSGSVTAVGSLLRSTLAALVVLTAMATACSPGTTPGNTAVRELPATSTTVADSAAAPPTLDIDELVQQWAADAEVVGAVALVSGHDRPDRLAVTGFADRETLAPTDADKRYRIGSITKLFTAVAVLRLVEDGALALDDPVADYLPGVDPTMTVRQLMNHSSGLPDPDVGKDLVTASLDASTVKSPREVVAQAIDAGVEWPPGSREHYSSLNYLFLGRIVEEVTGQPYPAALSRLVLDPLELGDTGFEDTGFEDTRSDDDITDLATPYERLDPDAAPLPLGALPTDVSVRASSSAGGLVSTSADLGAFMNALFNGGILAPSTLEQMLDGPTTSNAHYGLGPAAYRLGSRTVYGHNGRSIGFAASARHDPNTGVTVVVLANDGSAPTAELADHLIDTAAGGAET